MADFTTASWCWLYLGAFLMLGEIVTPGFVLFFFGLAAATVSGCKFLMPALSPAWQLALFSIFSIVYLVGLRRLVKGVFMGDSDGPAALVGEYVGRVGEIVEAASQETPGRVLIGDAEWTAVAGERIEKGTKVKVVAQKNLTLTVEPVR